MQSHLYGKYKRWCIQFLVVVLCFGSCNYLASSVQGFIREYEVLPLKNRGSSNQQIASNRIHLPALMDFQPVILQLVVDIPIQLQVTSFCKEHALDSDRCYILQKGINKLWEIEGNYPCRLPDIVLPAFLNVKSILVPVVKQHKSMKHADPPSFEWVHDDLSNIVSDMCREVEKNHPSCKILLSETFQRTYEWLKDLKVCAPQNTESSNNLHETHHAKDNEDKLIEAPRVKDISTRIEIVESLILQLRTKRSDRLVDLGERETAKQDNSHQVAGFVWPNTFQAMRNSCLKSPKLEDAHLCLSRLGASLSTSKYLSDGNIHCRPQFKVAKHYLEYTHTKMKSMNARNWIYAKNILYSLYTKVHNIVQVFKDSSCLIFPLVKSLDLSILHGIPLSVLIMITVVMTVLFTTLSLDDSNQSINWGWLKRYMSTNHITYSQKHKVKWDERLLCQLTTKTGENNLIVHETLLPQKLQAANILAGVYRRRILFISYLKWSKYCASSTTSTVQVQLSKYINERTHTHYPTCCFPQAMILLLLSKSPSSYFALSCQQLTNNFRNSASTAPDAIKELMHLSTSKNFLDNIWPEIEKQQINKNLSPRSNSQQDTSQTLSPKSRKKASRKLPFLKFLSIVTKHRQLSVSHERKRRRMSLQSPTKSTQRTSAA